MIGSILISLAFAAALVSMGSYAMTLRRESTALRNIARAGFHVAVISFLAASATLMYLIVTHQFQYEYIWSHSSTNLSTPLLMASFYAGQEGSFMLWTLGVSIIGVFVIGYAQRVRYESAVMAVWMLVLSMLLLILVVKSPFETIYEAFPNQNIPAGFIPENGKGLNPTLENIWITIHPPILFLGFAAMTVPFVFAMAGLIKRDYQRWISISLPWALFASATLGFGIMLGGWWAYETLGWGGFWAWDPVENSSLIPWLFCVSLVHTMLVQKRTGDSNGRSASPKVGGLVKTNFVLAILAFGAILYSTFLTRSGVLGDTSVHSFVAPGNFVYAVLLGVIILFMGLGVTMLARRWRELHQAALDMKMMSRENALGLGSAVILASATVVLIGTSWPILLPLFNKPKVAITPDFYNGIHLPIALLIVLLNGLSMTLKWKDTTPEEFLRKITTAVVIAALGTGGLVALGIHDPIYIGLGFGALLAMVVNVQIGAKVVRGNPRFLGAYISHAGISLLMLGIIFTARYSVTDHVQLAKGESKKVFDYTVTYAGAEQVDREKTDRERFEHKIVLERDGSTYEARPVLFWSDFNNRESAFLEPGIIYSPTKDIYISPKALEQRGGDPTATMHKGDRVAVPFDSSISVRFEKFDMTRAGSDGMQGAVMEVTKGDSTWYLSAFRSMRDGGFVPVGIPSTDITIAMVGLNSAGPDNLSNSEAVLQFSSKSHPPGETVPVITLDVSIKPFISFVWVGVIVMVGGFIFAIIRRRGEVDLHVPPSGGDQADVPPAPRVRPRRSRSRVDEQPVDDTLAAANAVRRS
jgi:cytochrome c-type biogenesis protein CcmF